MRATWPAEIEALTTENGGLQSQFERLKDDVKVLYSDKARLRTQLATAQAEAAEVEATVVKYRKSAANLIA